MKRTEIGRKGGLVFRAAAFLVILVLVLQALSWILMPRTSSDSCSMYNYRARGFYGEAKNTLDVVAIGNSDLSSAFSPMEIWQSHGISAYACGEPKQQIDQAVALLKEVLTCQKPKVVILEVDSLFQESMKGHLVSLLKTGARYAFPVVDYHDRWKDMDPKELLEGKTLSWHDANKGYSFSDDVVAYTGGDYMTENGETEELDTVATCLLDEFVSLCRTAGAEVLMVEMPSANSWTMARHEAVAAYAEKQQVPFIDFNINIEETGINWHTDSRDGGNHMNYSGACKLSAWLGDYLKENYELTDHREDAAYDGWAQDLKSYRKKTGTAA